MAYKPQNKGDSATVDMRADAFISADSFNITPDFFNKNKDYLQKIADDVNTIVKSYGYSSGPNSDLKNPLSTYTGILYGTMDKNLMQTELLNQKPSNLSSGMRSVSEEDLSNNIELGIINSYQKIVSESFSLMEEYRVAVSLIPELKRVIKLIVRDIINQNEITKRAIKDVYDVTTKDANSVDESDEDISTINDIIDKEITDKYKIEEKLDIWLNEALITGAKPVLVLPYRDIIRQAVALSSNKSYNKRSNGAVINGLNYSMEDFENEVEGIESFEEFEDKGMEHIDPFKIMSDFEHNRNVCESRGIEKLKYNYKSQEDLDAFTAKTEDFLDGIIDDEDVDAIFEEGMETLYSTLRFEQKKADDEKALRHSRGMESNDDEIYKTVNGIKDFIDGIEKNAGKSQEEIEEEEEEENARNNEAHIKAKIKEQLSEFVAKIDKNINVVKDEYANLSLGKNDLYTRIKHHKNNKNFVDGIYVKDASVIDEIADNFDKEVLIQELNPEYVIPISIGSEHIQYYVYEADAYAGPTQSPSRRSTSFANIIASTGYGNDKGLISASNGVSLVPNDPALSSVFNPANFGNINMPIEGNSLLQNDTRTEIMKQIVYKTLAKRMADPSLVENKSFKDAIINLIRQGYIVDRQIRFTAVPATNIVYFAHDLDDKGMPHSVLDGTLLQIYMYLAGVISVTMNIVKKSSDKEKLIVNMGMSKQIGMTLMEIQKQLSTRNIHVRSFFDNIGSVMRNVATYARYTVPYVDGERLYDVENVESRPESPIDTDFIEKRLSSILSALPCPPAIQNMINEAEFSRGLLNQNIEYRNSVMEKQNKFMKQITKLYRLLVLYSRLAKPTKTVSSLGEMGADPAVAPDNSNIKLIDIANINVKLSPPMALNMININESFSNCEPVIDSYAKYLFGEDQDTPLDKWMVQRFKKEALKIFAPNIDFSFLEDIAAKIKDNPFEGVSDAIKLKIMGKQTEGLFNGEGNSESSGGDSGGNDDMGTGW